MPEKPEIEKLRVYHDLQNQYEVPDVISKILVSQLSSDDQGRLERFMSGFKIEDWFQRIFSAMPWVQLIHGLDQQQFPVKSKELYQVPDFLLLVETSSYAHRPLLVEVKRVTKDKSSLKLQESQLELCERYGTMLGIPLVYAVYWERMSVWTLNTPDSFVRKSYSRKLQMTTALEMDCSEIIGDVYHFVPEELARVSTFSKHNITFSEHEVKDNMYGYLLTDIVSLRDSKVNMDALQSAAIDAILTMKRVRESTDQYGYTELTQQADGNYILKLSSWITRHLEICNTQPYEQHANTSAHVTMELMCKLHCPQLRLFPTGRSTQVARLDDMFRKTTEVTHSPELNRAAKR